MPREKGQRNNPVLRGEDALEVLNALAERETNASHIILGLGQRVLGLEGTSIRSGMDRNEDGRDMPTYAIAFTHPHRDTNFLAFLTSRQTWKPGEHGQLAFGIRIRVKETFKAHTQDLTACCKAQPRKVLETGTISAEPMIRSSDPCSISSGRSTNSGTDECTQFRTYVGWLATLIWNV